MKRGEEKGVRVDIKITSQWVVSSTLMANNKSVYETNLHPSSHPS